MTIESVLDTAATGTPDVETALALSAADADPAAIAAAVRGQHVVTATGEAFTLADALPLHLQRSKSPALDTPTSPADVVSFLDLTGMESLRKAADAFTDSLERLAEAEESWHTEHAEHHRERAAAVDALAAYADAVVSGDTKAKAPNVTVPGEEALTVRRAIVQRRIGKAAEEAIAAREAWEQALTDHADALSNHAEALFTDALAQAETAMEQARSAMGAAFQAHSVRGIATAHLARRYVTRPESPLSRLEPHSPSILSATLEAFAWTTPDGRPAEAADVMGAHNALSSALDAVRALGSQRLALAPDFADWLTYRHPAIGS